MIFITDYTTIFIILILYFYSIRYAKKHNWRWRPETKKAKISKTLEEFSKDFEISEPDSDCIDISIYESMYSNKAKTNNI